MRDGMYKDGCSECCWARPVTLDSRCVDYICECPYSQYADKRRNATDGCIARERR